MMFGYVFKRTLDSTAICSLPHRVSLFFPVYSIMYRLNHQPAAKSNRTPLNSC